MSGGVDSSVAAARVAATGLRAFGITLAMWRGTQETVRDRGCCSIDAVDDARRVATALALPHYVWNLEQDFESEVVRDFEAGYERGITPNPCVRCNQRIKFGVLLERARAAGATHLATGHYARLVHGEDGPHLFAGEPSKDQSYALAQLAPEQLAHLLLPVGDLSKVEAREQAARLGLPVHDKPESQDICFVEGGDYRSVLERVAPIEESSGTIVTVQGQRIGTHAGIAGFTVGQRRGLPATHFNDGPRYVTRIDAATNTIVIGCETELLSESLIAGDLNLIRPERFASGTTRVRAMTRYRSPLNFAHASLEPETAELRLRFEEPERAVAPGQLVALYDERADEVLGAATIRSAA